MKKGKIGSSLDDFLKEEGIYDKVVKRAKNEISKKKQNKKGGKVN